MDNESRVKNLTERSALLIVLLVTPGGSVGQKLYVLAKVIEVKKLENGDLFVLFRGIGSVTFNKRDVRKFGLFELQQGDQALVCDSMSKNGQHPGCVGSKVVDVVVYPR